MTRDETVLILRHMSCSLPNFNYRDDGVLETWHNVLKEYDYTETFKKVNTLLEEDRFQYQAPTPQFVVRDLRKKSEKIKLNSYKVACRNCGKMCSSYEDEERHFDRCSSVEYILNLYKRFNLQCTKTKKELFEMPEQEFDDSYNKILKYVMEHMTDVSEKERIGFIFNPPSEEKARNYLNRGN